MAHLINNFFFPQKRHKADSVVNKKETQGKTFVCSLFVLKNLIRAIFLPVFGVFPIETKELNKKLDLAQKFDPAIQDESAFSNETFSSLQKTAANFKCVCVCV